MAALGARLLVGREVPQAPAEGAVLIAQAAADGYPAAWSLVAVIAAAGVGRTQSWADALDALGRAAELGDPEAAPQIALLRGLGIETVRHVQAWLTSAPSREIHRAPRLAAYPAFLTPEVCNHLIERSRPRLVPARVNDARGGGLKLDPMRTNTCAVYSLVDTDLVMQLVRARIARTAGVPAQALEPAEVLHYFPGETYRPHIDFFHPKWPGFSGEMRARGQRVKTCLVYLNDDLEGGETEFPKLGIRFRGARGEALIFDNVGPNGAGDLRTLHTGLPPTRGEKWLLSQWMRSKSQPVA